MKTRTLMLLSVVCGLAIMLAGAAFLVQLSSQDDVLEPVPVGQRTAVGDMNVTVDGFTEDAGELRVRVTLGGTEDLDPGDDFRLIAAGRPVAPASSDCPPVDGTGASCEVTFDVREADGRSRVLFYERGEDRARWVVDGP